MMRQREHTGSSSMDLQLAWRNIWRNPRRTGVILVAVIIGVWSMVFLGALMRGIIEGMVDNGIATLTGHVLIHQKDYPDDPVVVHRIDDAAGLAHLLDQALPPGSHWTGRIRVNAVADNARHTTGVTLVGVDPAAEAAVSFIGRAVTAGTPLGDLNDRGIIIGRALAERMDTRIGRKLILMSQSVHGDIASRAYRIAGLFNAEMQSTEKQFVFVTRASAAKMLAMGEGISEISITLPRRQMAEAVAADLEHRLPASTYRVRTWKQALPLLRVYLNLYDGFVLIWFIVVFVAMGFGIVNTTLMAVFERMREFGLLKALGMRPWRIVKAILTESFFLLICGMVAGNALGLVSCWALSFHGIDLSALAAGVEFANMARVIFPAIWPRDIITANLVILVLGMIVSLYPAVKAARFSPVDAMTHT